MLTFSAMSSEESFQLVLTDDGSESNSETQFRRIMIIINDYY